MLCSLGRSATSPLPFQPAGTLSGAKGYAWPASLVAPARYCLLIGHRFVHRRLSHYGNRSPLSSDMKGKRRFGFNPEGVAELALNECEVVNNVELTRGSLGNRASNVCSWADAYMFIAAA